MGLKEAGDRGRVELGPGYPAGPWAWLGVLGRGLAWSRGSSGAWSGPAEAQPRGAVLLRGPQDRGPVPAGDNPEHGSCPRGVLPLSLSRFILE